MIKNIVKVLKYLQIYADESLTIYLQSVAGSAIKSTSESIIKRGLGYNHTDVQGPLFLQV